MLVAAFVVAATGAMAQDIYTAGTAYANGDGTLHVQKNGQDIRNWSANSSTFGCTDMIVGGDGCVYFTVTCIISSTLEQRWTDIYKYDPATDEATRIYDCPAASGIKINDLAWYNGSIYGAGYYKTDPDEDGRVYALVVKDDAILYEGAQDGYEDAFWGITIDPEGNIWTVGAEASNEGSGVGLDGYYCAYGSIYKNGEHQYDMWNTDTNYSRFNDVVFYNGMLYICGVEHRTSAYTTSPWDGVFYRYIPSSTSMNKIAQVSNDYPNFSTEFQKMCYDAGSMYIVGVVACVGDKVWQYSTWSPDLDLNEILSLPGSPSSPLSITANSSGIYCAHYDGKPVVYTSIEQDFSLINLNYGDLNDIYPPTQIAVINPTLTGREYDLPFEEYFEYGNTAWDEWLKYDSDNSNGQFNSFWERGNNLGHYYDLNGCHRFGSTSQGGDLVSPAINLPAASTITLSFLTKNYYPEDYHKNSVFIAERPYSSFVLNADTYTTLSWDKLWENSQPEESWCQYFIDLSEYKGKTVYLSFWYYGENADSWMVDDIEITAHPDGISDSENALISVMPNPASTSIRLEGLEKAETISIYNTVGQLVNRIENYTGKEISVEGLPAGVYLVRIEESGKALRFVVK